VLLVLLVAVGATGNNGSDSTVANVFPLLYSSHFEQISDGLNPNKISIKNINSSGKYDYEFLKVPVAPADTIVNIQEPTSSPSVQPTTITGTDFKYMTFINDGSQNHDMSATPIEYPITPQPNKVLTWTDGNYAIITKTSDLTWDENAAAPNGNLYNVGELFDNLTNDNGLYHSLQVFSTTSPFAYTGSSTFKGNTGISLYIDMGRNIIPRSMRMIGRNSTSNVPSLFKIYASDDPNAWTDTTHSSWDLIHNQTSTLSYTAGSFTSFGTFNLN